MLSIKSLFTSSTPKLALFALVSLMLLPGCSTSPSGTNANKQTTTDPSLKGMDKDIVDLVSLNTKSVNNSTSISAGSTDNRNMYLEQASQRLADVPTSVLSQYQQAISQMKNQQWQAANSLFDKVIVAEPQLSGAYVNKAIIAINQQQLDQADALLAKAIAVNNSNPYAHQIKANIARVQGQYAQAEQGYLTALTLWPQYPLAQLNLAILLELYRGKLLQARQYYLAYLANQPNDEQAKRWLAGVEIKIQRAGLTLPPDNANGAG
ncbi:tetratricopeptide repeat protein [Shewanella sp. Arc9-LZ]|uniref:tetratricopeptide repeat protein n=1 Tax=Shewanella sp. Arc9-LZ TaxID=2698686 RepID=UPI00137BC33B|nr:tetratricopeptide repeat protein [Shewanella sp. Arc9-LZ]QHS12837.1 tetratricopeptide repeat protein [Shewanella sp. Arc9-LZ]